MNKKTAFPLIAITVLGLAACRHQETPVARVDVQPRRVELPYSQLTTVHLTWTPSASIGDERPTVFVHLLDGHRRVARTFDHPFPDRWREGSPVGYDLKLYQSAIADPLPPGKYQVTLGLYGRNGKRWPLDGLGESRGRDEYDAFEVQVPNANPSPRFAFSPNWMDVEAGGDRQVVARRWLLGRGSIRLVDQHAPGTVWMVVQIPATTQKEYRMAFAAGENAPAVKIEGNCGSGETNLTGPGLHEVTVNVDAPPPGDFCHLLLSANFTLEPRVPAASRRSASLENLAWIPGGGKAPAPAVGAGSSATSPTSPE